MREIEKDIELILEHQGIGLDQGAYTLYKMQEELEILSRETFYSILKTDKGWKNLFMILGVIGFILLFLEKYWSWSNATNFFAIMIILLFIVVMVLLPLIKFVYKRYANNSKNDFTKVKVIISNGFEVLLSSLILGLSYNSIQIKLCEFIYYIGSKYYRSSFLVVLIASIVLFIFIIYLAKKMLLSLHKKWRFLSTQSLILNSLFFMSMLIVAPVLKIFESLEIQNAEIKKDILFLANFYCITGVMMFIFSIVIIQNFSVTKKYKAKYETLFKLCKNS